MNAPLIKKPISQESVVNFGPKDREGRGKLFGILTVPDADKRITDAPIAIILNAGIVHRIGPFRMHVDLARNLADQGFTTLRIDLSGLGDSSPRTGTLENENRAILDVSDAMDHLANETGTNRFVLLGLCSGAYNAHQAAVVDSRIVGCVFLDGIVFRSAEFYFRHYFLRFLKPRFWRNAVKRRLLKRKDEETDGAASSLAEEEFFGGELCRSQVREELNGLVERDVQMLFVYTEGYDDICSASQIKAMYGLQPGTDQIQVEYYSKAEHTFRLTENRQAACERIVDWYGNRFVDQ